MGNIGQNKKALLEKYIRSLDPSVLDLVPVDGYVRRLLALPRYSPYWILSPDLTAMATQLYERGGDLVRDKYHQLVLLTLIEDFKEGRHTMPLPDSIQRLFIENLKRIISVYIVTMQSNEKHPYEDLFLLSKEGIQRSDLDPYCHQLRVRSLSTWLS